MFTHSIVVHCNFTTVPKNWFMKICIYKNDPQVSTYILILVHMVCTTIYPRHLSLFGTDNVENLFGVSVASVTSMALLLKWNILCDCQIDFIVCSIHLTCAQLATRRDSSLIMHKWGLAWLHGFGSKCQECGHCRKIGVQEGKGYPTDELFPYDLHFGTQYSERKDWVLLPHWWTFALWFALWNNASPPVDP